MNDEARAEEPGEQRPPPPPAPPAPPGRGLLRFHLRVGDLDAIDGLVDFPGAEPRFEPVVGGANALHLDDLLLPGGLAVIPPNFAARIGLNETPLTRAIAAGEFDIAETLVRQT